MSIRSQFTNRVDASQLLATETEKRDSPKWNGAE